MRCAAGFMPLPFDPSNRLRDAVEHIDKDLSALVFGPLVFYVAVVDTWVFCQDLKGRSSVFVVESHIRTTFFCMCVCFLFFFCFSPVSAAHIAGKVGEGKGGVGCGCCD